MGFSRLPITNDGLEIINQGLDRIIIVSCSIIVR